VKSNSETGRGADFGDWYIALEEMGRHSRMESLPDHRDWKMYKSPPFWNKSLKGNYS
jgi:hypothetical protein